MSVGIYAQNGNQIYLTMQKGMPMSQRYVALLRGVNVGGHNRLPSDVFKKALANSGATQISTYIQSGNAVFTADQNLKENLAVQLEELAEISVPTFVTTDTAFRAAMSATPFKTEDPKTLHLFFLIAPPSDADLAALDKTVGPDEDWTLLNDVVYLHTPNGFGRSKLAEVASRKLSATARNWRTVTKIAELF